MLGTGKGQGGGAGDTREWRCSRSWGAHSFMGDTLTVMLSERSVLGRPWAEGGGGGLAALLRGAQGGPSGSGLWEHWKVSRSSPGGLGGEV